MHKRTLVSIRNRERELRSAQEFSLELFNILLDKLEFSHNNSRRHVQLGRMSFGDDPHEGTDA